MPAEEQEQPERKSAQWSFKCVLIAEGGLFAATLSFTLSVQKDNLKQVSSLNIIKIETFCLFQTSESERCS